MRCRISSAIVNHWSIASLLAAAVVCSFFPGWAFSSGYPALPIGDKLKIPVGTVLPVSLEHSLSSKDSVKGEAIEGRIMQDVLLPGEGKISAGSKILGTIVDVVSAEQGASITFSFSSVESHHDSLPVVVALRVMAPFEDVQAAQTPYQDSGTGSVNSWATTLQIGGDVRYGDGGKVTNSHNRKVGKATQNSGVLALLQDSPGSPCAGWPSATEGPQAVWIFSTSACGLFDLKKMRIAHAGNKDPLGQITLAKSDGDIKIMKSSAMLLRVVH